MGIFRQMFGNKATLQLTEPIFPGERFSILKLNFSDGWGLATVNKAYDNYPNKFFYPWHVLVELEIIDKNENGHPTGSEAEKLNGIEDDIKNMLTQKQTVHFVARIVRNGFRDLIFYIDQPRLEQKELDTFFEDIMKEREVNFSMHKDPDWKSIGFIK